MITDLFTTSRQHLDTNGGEMKMTTFTRKPLADCVPELVATARGDKPKNTGNYRWKAGQRMLW